MYFSIQYPLLDTRIFQTEYAENCFNPMLYMNENNVFCRGFGELKNRRSGPAIPSSELEYIESKKAVKFSGQFTKQHLLNITERLYIDEDIIHFDLGIKTQKRTTRSYAQFLSDFKKLLLEKLFQYDGKTVDFMRLQEILAEKYRRATTFTSSTHTWRGKCIYPGLPVVFVEYREDEITDIPEYLNRFPIGETSHILYDTVFLKPKTVYLWLIRRGNHSQNMTARQFRIGLSKTHHNLVTMSIFIKWMKSGVVPLRDLNPDAALKYIDKMLHIIRKQDRKRNRNEIYDRAIDMYILLNEQPIYDRENILNDFREQMRDLRKQLTQISTASFTRGVVN